MSDFAKIKTTGNRAYNEDYIDYINGYLLSKGVPDSTREIFLGNIIEESGGNPFAESPGGVYYGLLQWDDSRYKKTNESDPYKEIENQLNYLLSSVKNTTDKVSWTYGGTGSGYKYYIEPYNIFHDEKKSIEDRHRAFSFGYVRPAGK